MSTRTEYPYYLPPMSPEPDAVQQETRMKRAFMLQAEDVLKDPDKYTKPRGGVKVGLEVEYSILDDKLSPASETQRNAIIDTNPSFTDSELGAAQLEWRTDPLDLKEKGIKALEEQLAQRETEILNTAAKNDLHLLSSGTNPLIQIKDIVRTTKDKYQLVPNFHNDNKRQGLDTVIGIIDKVDVRDAAVCGITNSVQCNVEASSFEDAIEKLNRSFAIGPMAVAMSGNARFLEGKDTGLADTRMIAWEVSHDTRTLEEQQREKTTRIGLPSLYYNDMRDYFQRISAQPFILNIPEAALPIGIGLNWRDTRIKVLGDSLVVEFRPVSTQPTIKENTAMMVFYLGRLLWSQQNSETLLDLKLVKENRNEAMIKGLKGQLWTQLNKGVGLLPADHALALEIDRSMAGLKTAGFKLLDYSDYFDLLKERVEKKETPSDELARLVKFASYKDGVGITQSEALALALNQTRALF